MIKYRRPISVVIFECITGTMDPMELSADIVFVVDSSATVSRHEYEHERKFLQGLAQQLNVSPGKSRASMITYGKNSRIENRFDGYRTSSEFEQIVKEALYMGGPRRIGRALGTADRVLQYSRSQIQTIVVCFISGREGLAAQPLEASVKAIRDHGAKLFIVAFGNNHGFKGVDSLVDEQQNIFRITSSDDFTDWIIPTSRIIAARSRMYIVHKCIFSSA